MKVLTLTQPYATLISLGQKKIETRSWETLYRGPLAIHAAKGPGSLGSFKAMRDLCGMQPFFDALMTIVPNYNDYCDRDAIFEHLPSGAIIATCALIDCVPTWPNWASEEPWFIGERDGGETWKAPPPEPERSFGDYSAGRFAWLLANVKALPEPIPCKGALGLWNYEGAL